MNRSRTVRTFAAAGLALGLAFGLSACGKAADKLSEKAAEKVAEKAAGGNANVDIDSKDGSFKIETEDGSFQMGGGEIPANWPSDIPLMKGFTPEGHMNMSSGNETNITLNGTADASIDDLIDFYKDAMSGWETDGATTISNDDSVQKSIMFKKDTQSLLVNASTSGDEPGTTVSFMYMDEQE